MAKVNTLSYPRPQFVRDEWLSLDGTWDFRFEQEDWQTIVVPYVYQSEMSGINTNRPCDCVAYRRSFTVPPAWKNRRVRLNFGAVDYACDVWVNGCHVGGHTGGNIGFALDITDAIGWNTEELLVKVSDPWNDELIPRGKQYWIAESDAIWYKRTTGIWQSVWLEPVDTCCIEQLRFTGDIDRGQVEIDYICSKEAAGARLNVEIALDDRLSRQLSLVLTEHAGKMTVDLFENHIFRSNFHNSGWCWTPESPTLFDVEVCIERDGKVCDRVRSYFGMRKVEARDGRVYLNNKPYYQKLILDQGYWPQSLMTPPDEEAIRQDILMAKAMGFNGCRKHQKAEDTRFLYWADRLGYLVWGEIGSCISFSPESARRLMAEWGEAVMRDYNHPSIVAWVPINESWGVPNIARDSQHQALALALYYQCRALDPTRLVVGNDGWEMTRSDICAIHNYRHGAPDDAQAHERFEASLSSAESLISTQPAGRPIYADGWQYDGAPILLTEFGGISLVNSVEKAWGYTQVNETDTFVAEYRRILEAIGRSHALYGFCYTQLTDVEQETNGLLTYNRQYKVNPEIIREINDRVAGFDLG